MIRVSACLLVGLLAFGQSVEPALKNMELGVRLRATVRRSTDFVLRVTLRNTGRVPVVVQKSGLPWGNRYSMIVVAVGADLNDGTTIREVYPIDDSVPAEFTIPPGETVEGDVPLKDRFPTLPEVLKERDVVLFWSYQLETIDHKRSTRFGGWLLIPRSG